MLEIGLIKRIVGVSGPYAFFMNPLARFEQFLSTDFYSLVKDYYYIPWMSCSALVNWLELHLIDPIPVLMLRYVVVSRE